MTEQMLAELLRLRTQFVTRYRADHPGADLADALTAAFSAGVTAALNVGPSQN
jgi:hypothetical protein